ncbi:MAG: hypothetical protein K2P93_01570 [Alphaproteobacteria bacterium]|nr:hypothetical protein [Alphaproteobacteria bacterium]
MYLYKIFVNLFLLFYICVSYSILHAGPIFITEIDEIVKYVKTLRTSKVDANNIGIILDCHGVITEEDGHRTSHTLKGNIREALAYFQEERIAVVVATAWDNLDEVVQHAIVPTGLGHFFGVIPDKKTELEDFAVGSGGAVKLKGYKNGNIVALKNAFNFENTQYFRQKAFALEVIYPENIFTHIIGVDDDTNNLKIFETRDFPRTRQHSVGASLTLFHLESPGVTVSLASGFKFSPPSFQPIPLHVSAPLQSTFNSFSNYLLSFKNILPRPNLIPNQSNCAELTQPSPSFRVSTSLRMIIEPYEERKVYFSYEAPREDNFDEEHGDDPDEEQS